MYDEYAYETEEEWENVVSACRSGKVVQVLTALVPDLLAELLHDTASSTARISSTDRGLSQVSFVPKEKKE